MHSSSANSTLRILHTSGDHTRHVGFRKRIHYCDVILRTMASQISSLTVVYSRDCSDINRRKLQSFASLAFLWWTRRWPVNFPHKGPVTQKMFPFDHIITAKKWASVWEFRYWWFPPVPEHIIVDISIQLLYDMSFRLIVNNALFIRVYCIVFVAEQ